MDCQKIEEIISDYIEHELPEEVRKDVALHLESCPQCRKLEEKVEEMIYSFSQLEEDVPFFLKNRLLFIPESQEDENIVAFEDRRMVMRWVAAVIGAFVLFLNLFYFTNVYPPANRAMHSVVSGLETMAVKAQGFFERLNESRKVLFYSSAEAKNEGNKKRVDQENGSDGDPEKKFNQDGEDSEDVEDVDDIESDDVPLKKNED